MFRSISNRCRCLSLSLLLVGAVFAQSLGVKLANGAYRLEGWTGSSHAPATGWESVFPVYAGSSKTPMLGTYSVEGNALIFQPRFPVESGVSVRGTFPGGTFFFAPSPSPAPATHVEHLYPSAAILPANTLRLYVYFSGPMSAGDALRHIHLIDETGKPVPDAFLDQELWDAAHTRLTLLFDPGRIKRGLRPAGEMGTPIQPGQRYTLIIDKSMRDGRGAPLTETFHKSLVGGPADRSPADPKSWRIHAPKAGTTEPFVVDFPKPMDYALLQRMLWVKGVRGAVAVGAGETEWRFTPEAPWLSREYALEMETDLEDICGNRLDRPFDIDLHQRAAAQPGKRILSVSFFVN